MAEADSEIVLFGGWRISIERQAYATIVLMSVLILFEGWERLATFGDVAIVILGPILALALAHFFAELLQDYADLQRPLTGDEWLAGLQDQGQLLLTAVPSMIVLAIGWRSSIDEPTTVRLLVWTGAVTLVVLAGWAGYRAGLRGWRWGVAALGGGMVGLFVMSLQLVLKPH